MQNHTELINSLSLLIKYNCISCKSCISGYTNKYISSSLRLQNSSKTSLFKCLGAGKASNVMLLDARTIITSHLLKLNIMVDVY